MINAYFGDCFVIRNNELCNVVDFATHKKSKMGAITRDDFHKYTADYIHDLSKNSSKLLITHFHEDHISELINLTGVNTTLNLL